MSVHSAQPGNLQRSRKRSILAYLRQHWFLYMLVVPGLAFLVLFSYGPMYGVLLAFKDFKYKLGVVGSPWADPLFKYFTEFLTDEYFWKVLRNTVLINVYNLVFGFTFTVFLALMLSEMRLKKTKSLVQTAVYLPYFLSWIIFSSLITTFLGDEGAINGLIQYFGGESINFLTDNAKFRAILVITNTIKNSGYGTIIYLAAIAGVNPELYESARIDGANRYHLIRHVTLPRIYPTIAILLILELSGLFSSNFDQVYNMYSPLVYETGDVISTYIYRTGIGSGKYSFSTALNLLFNSFGLIIVIIANKFTKKLDVMGIF